MPEDVTSRGDSTWRTCVKGVGARDSGSDLEVSGFTRVAEIRSPLGHGICRGLKGPLPEEGSGAREPVRVRRSTGIDEDRRCRLSV